MESTAQTTAERQALVDRLSEIDAEEQEALKPHPTGHQKR